MKSAFEKILNQESLGSVMRSVAQSDPQDLETTALGLDNEQITQLGIWSSHIIRTRGLEKTLREGCIFHLYRLATAPEKRRELFDNLLDDAGVSRTQAFRSIAAWQRCGVALMHEIKLMSRFVSESLKLLGELATSDEAVEAAFELARKGERISIQTVRQLQSKFPIAANDQEIASDKPKPEEGQKQDSPQPEKLVRQFVSRLARIIRSSKQPIARKEVDSMITHLEEVISALRQQQSGMERQTVSGGV